MTRKNSQPFDTNSSGGRRKSMSREDGSLGRVQPSPESKSRLMGPTFSSAQKKRMPAMNRSLIIHPQKTIDSAAGASDGEGQMLNQKSMMGVKKKKTVVKKVVRKRMVPNTANS